MNFYPLRKLAGQLHLWLGMTSGIVIIILGITGCIYTFTDELRPIIYRDRLFIDPPANNMKMLPLEDLKMKAQMALNKKVSLLDIEIFTDRKHTMTFRYRDRNDQANLYTRYFINYDKVYLNPYTGGIVKVENTKWEFFNLVVMVHCTLLLGNLGKQIITCCTIVFIIMLLSGLLLWWPKNKTAAGKRFSFTWKAGSTWKRKNYDLHQILGFYTVLISFFVALSGLSMIMPQLDHAIQYAVDLGQTNTKSTMLHTSHMGGSIQGLKEKNGILNEVGKHAATMNADAVRYRIFSPKAKKDPIVVKNYTDKATHYAYLQDQYDPFTAKHTTSAYYSELSAGEKIHELSYDIHVGAIFGIPGKILVFLASLITATLPISGFLIWKGRRKKL